MDLLGEPNMSSDSAVQGASAAIEDSEALTGWPDPVDTYRQRMLTLLDANRPSLLAYLRRMRLATEDAEDVLQETCIRLLSAPESWRGERSAFGFIYKIAGNLARDELRRRRRRYHQHHCSYEDVELACSAPHPAECLEQSRASEQLSRALARLTPRCQKVVNLHYVDNMSFRRIATHLGVSKKTIERDLNLARDYCHALLERAS
jgi:RNA polymerase sigma factor (sigma-70 family)